MSWKSVFIFLGGLASALLLVSVFKFPFMFKPQPNYGNPNYNNPNYNQGNPNYNNGYMGPGMMGPGMMGPQYQYPNAQNPNTQKTNFKSNGERIYFTAQDNDGVFIRANMLNMPMSSMVAGCVGCHGPEGKGGVISMMMGRIEVPDIRYQKLSKSHEEGGEEHEHPPYNETTVKRAITRGLDPGGDQLNYVMPRWTMSNKDLNDLVTYLKSL